MVLLTSPKVYIIIRFGFMNVLIMKIGVYNKPVLTFLFVTTDNCSLILLMFHCQYVNKLDIVLHDGPRFSCIITLFDIKVQNIQ